MARARKIRSGICSAADADDAFPEKPKVMHWKTYRRLEAKYERLMENWAVAAIRLALRDP